MNAAGEQLDGRLLFERQKGLRASQTFAIGPVIIAAGLQLAENMGSVLRVADAAGSQKVIFIGDAVAQIHLNRTARHTDILVGWEFCPLEDFIARGAEFQPLIALELTTESKSLFEAALPNLCTFVIGSERYGISDTILALCQQAVHIPMYGFNGSMNVTHALAIALFEWRRQHSPNNQ